MEKTISQPKYGIFALQTAMQGLRLRRKQPGWVLWEVMLGLILILTLLGVMYYNFPAMLETSHTSTAKHDLTELQTAAVAHCAMKKNNSIDSLEELRSSISDSDSIDGAEHKSFLGANSSLSDPWGNDYQINTTSRTIWSTGGENNYGDDDNNPLRTSY